MTNPTAYKRLQAEIDELDDNVADCATQAHLPYLNAVLYDISWVNHIFPANNVFS